MNKEKSYNWCIDNWYFCYHATSDRTCSLDECVGRPKEPLGAVWCKDCVDWSQVDSDFGVCKVNSRFEYRDSLCFHGHKRRDDE